ncbi:MAG: hypothetical protein U0M05_06945 [Clostridia bacterium]|nr:hypothetical protein [Clostridia bacterium]
MDNQNLNVLDEINKGATMGMDAISFISQKVEDNQFKNILKTEYNKYKDISARVNKLYNNFATNKEPHETNTMNKMMTWYGIQMKTMTDDTTSKLSELLMQGTNMGIIEGRRLINQNANVSSDVKNILHDFVTMQEDSVETLKKYL